MKWSEMSVFHKAVFVSGALSSLAMVVVALYSLIGVLPGLYDNPLFITLFGMSWLGQFILNWKKHRLLAIFQLIFAVICFTPLCYWIVSKLIIS